MRRAGREGANYILFGNRNPKKKEGTRGECDSRKLVKFEDQKIQEMTGLGIASTEMIQDGPVQMTSP